MSSETKTTSNKARQLALIGLVLGVPMSYYFQPGLVRAKLSLTQYIGKLPELLGAEGGQFISPIVMSCLLFAIAGGVIGYFMDQAARSK